MTYVLRVFLIAAVIASGAGAVKALSLLGGAETAGTAYAQETVPAEAPQACEARTLSDAFARRVGADPMELDVLRSLADRRRTLDAREDELDTREALVQAAEMRVENRIARLEALQTGIETLIGQMDDRQAAEIQRIVDMYRAMDPRDAAEIIPALSEDMQVRVAANMSERAFAAILQEMPPAAAARLTERLAVRFELPETVAELEARLEGEG